MTSPSSLTWPTPTNSTSNQQFNTYKQHQQSAIQTKVIFHINLCQSAVPVILIFTGPILSTFQESSELFILPWHKSTKGQIHRWSWEDNFGILLQLLVSMCKLTHSSDHTHSHMSKPYLCSTFNGHKSKQFLLYVSVLMKSPFQLKQERSLKPF